MFRFYTRTQFSKINSFSAQLMSRWKIYVKHNKINFPCNKWLKSHISQTERRMIIHTPILKQRFDNGTIHTSGRSMSISTSKKRHHEEHVWYICCIMFHHVHVNPQKDSCMPTTQEFDNFTLDNWRFTFLVSKKTSSKSDTRSRYRKHIKYSKGKTQLRIDLVT